MVVGCAQSPNKATQRAKRAAGSWGATLSAAADWWGSGEISTSYFESLVTQARAALKKESVSARQSGGDAAAALVDAVGSRADAIAAAARRGDRAGAIHEAHAAAMAAPAEKTPPVARPE